MSSDGKGPLRIEITSVDGNLTHPFKPTTTVAEVKDFAYQRLVQDKSAIPLTATTMEVGGAPVSDELLLSALVANGGKPGREIDLSLALTWVSQGG